MPDEFISVDIRGIEQVCARLKGAAPRIAQRCFARALAAAAVPIVEALETATPEREEGSRDEEGKHLNESIVTEILIDSQGKGGRVKIGFGKLGWIARLVEYGHRMIGHKPGLKESKHSPVIAKSFMRPSAAASANASIEAFGEALLESLEEEGL